MKLKKNESHSPETTGFQVSGFSENLAASLQAAIEFGQRECELMLKLPPEYFEAFNKLGPDMAEFYRMEFLHFETIEELRFHFSVRKEILPEVAGKLSRGEPVARLQLDHLLSSIRSAIGEGRVYQSVPGRIILKSLAFLDSLHARWGGEPWNLYKKIPMESLPGYFETRTIDLEKLLEHLEYHSCQG